MTEKGEEEEGVGIKVERRRRRWERKRGFTDAAHSSFTLIFGFSFNTWIHLFHICCWAINLFFRTAQVGFGASWIRSLLCILCWLLDSLTPEDLCSGLRRKFVHKLANYNRAGIHAQHTQQQQLSALISSSVPRRGAVNLRNPLQQWTAGKRNVAHLAFTVTAEDPSGLLQLVWLTHTKVLTVCSLRPLQKPFSHLLSHSQNT